MKTFKSFGLLALLSWALAGCAGLHQDKGKFTATGYSANILFLQIPQHPMELAQEKVPEGASISNVNGDPQDWRSLPGFFNRLLGVGRVQIGGTIEE